MAIPALSPHVPLLALSAGVTGGLALYGWRRHPEPGSLAFAGLMVCATVWTASYAIALTIPDTETGARLFWERMMWIGITPLPVPWVVFALEYSGVGDVSRRQILALLAVPAAALVAVWTNGSHHLIWQSSNAVTVGGGLGGEVTIVIQSYGVGFLAYFVYAYALIAVGMVLLLRASVTADYLYADQAVALAIGAVVPSLVNVASVTGMVPIPGMDFTPHAYAVTGIAFGNALFRYDILDRLPATRRKGRNTVVEDMRDGVVVVDDGGTVIDVNPLAERTLGEPESELVGAPAAAVFGGTLPDLAERPTADLDGEEFRTEDGEWFELRVSELQDDRGRSVGDVLVFRNVTGRRSREQRLEVLNRLLRHNFRNEMTVVTGYAEALADGLDGQEAERAERIGTTAARLTKHADKARTLERLMDRRNEAGSPVDLDPVVADVVADVAERFPGAEFDTSVPADLWIRSNGSAEAVLENAVENAVEHNDAPDPTVEVSATAAEGGVELRVVDDGPGIPDHELEVLDAGTETPLKHGSGLGLWLIHWGVESLGGEVSFEERDGGTVVRLWLPGGSGDPEP